MLNRLWVKALFMVILFAGLVFLPGAACNFTAGTQSTPTVNGKPTNIMSPAKSVYTVGDRINLDYAAFTVMRVENSAGDMFTTPSPNMVLVLIQAEIMNLSRDQLNYLMSEFTLTDSSGHVYDNNLVVEDALGNGTINKGGTLRGSIEFEIPATAKGLVLSWAPGFSSTVIKVDLGR
jgi:hypothetical protein